MKKFNVKKLFITLCGTELEFLRYVNRNIGEKQGIIDFDNAAETLNVSKGDIRATVRRLSNAGVIVTVSETIQINSEYFKE